MLQKAAMIQGKALLKDNSRVPITMIQFETIQERTGKP